MIESSADSMFVWNSSGIIDMINPAVTKTFGDTPEQLLGESLVSLLAPDQAEPNGQ
jgi:PAS domain S-box-containing protein